MIQSIVSTVGWIYKSQGRTDWMFRWGLVVGILGIFSFMIGVYLGSIEYVALCYAILNIILLYWNISIPGKLIDLKFYEVLRTVAGIFGCGLAMTVTVFLLGLVLPDSWSPWANLIIQSAFGSLIYGLLIHLFNVQAYDELTIMLGEQWRRRKTITA
jgi:hypothetical protein